MKALPLRLSFLFLLIGCGLISLFLLRQSPSLWAAPLPAAPARLQAALTPLSDITQIAAGDRHTCALTTAGAVLCWGTNWAGQLGDGTFTDRTTPVPVIGLSSGVKALTAGYGHTCALTAAGAVLCWGHNDSGQLGDNTTVRRYTPVAVTGLSSGVQAIAAGSGHTCALTTAGAVYCWGGNYYGTVGDNTSINRSIPIAVNGLNSGVQAIVAGVNHTCAVTTVGAVFCWGYNRDGQLGDNTTINRAIPVAVPDLSSGVQTVTAGRDHTCALTTSSAVLCWGYNWNGQLGDGSTTARPTPVAVSGLSSGVQTITAGNSHTCALTTASAVFCWGYNGNGQLGDGSTTARPTPVAVSGLSSGVQAIAARSDHTCAVTTTGSVRCWGDNWDGQLGNGITGRVLTPAAVSGLSSGGQAISSGDYHTCALTTAGAVLCWGNNRYGQLGDGTTTYHLTPVVVPALTNRIQAITSGGDHICALTTAGAVLCWGSNRYGQLGDGSTTNRLTPVAVTNLSSGVQAISAGDYHTCALTTAGAVLCWGYNYYGQLGDGSTTNRLIPVALTNLSSGIQAITASLDHTCALTTTGAALCWGKNEFGQLGDGSTTNRPMPVAVTNLSNGVQAISAGMKHTCAMTAAGAVFCWGDNSSGQLGDGTATAHITPGGVTGLNSGVRTINAGRDHTCAVTTDGRVRCWGLNTYGRLGDGSTISRPTPVAVIGLSSGVQAIAASWGHTCAVTTTGAVHCWGHNGKGQVGNGTAGFEAVPVPVLVAEATPTPSATPTATPTATATPTHTPTATPTATATPKAGLDLTNACPGGVGDVPALINAIDTANSDSIADTITLAPNCRYTLTAANNGSYPDQNGLPVIISQVIIVGNGAIIERSTAPGIPAFRLWFIAYSRGSLTLQNVTTRNGANISSIGGGFLNEGGSLTLIDSAVMSNTAPSYGGAIYNGGVLVLRNSTIRYNQSGVASGIANDGVMTVTNSTISDNRDIYGYAVVHNSVLGQSTLEQSTIAANQGQGIINLGVMLVRNSTISGNQKEGFYNESSGIATISNSTISNNNGSGLYNKQSLTLHNSIVATQRTGVDCVGTISATRNNVDSDGSCGEATTTTAPQLGPLQINAPGNTATHALLSGSPAIDAGDPATCLTTDQRGVTRPLDGNGDNVALCDLGAYEAPAATFATITIVHDAVPNSATNFRFSGGLGSFYLDDITPQDGDAYSNSKSFTVAPGVYNVTEVVPSTWSLAGIVCTPAANGNVNLALKRVTLTMTAGTNVTCTFTDHRKATFNTLVFHDQDQDRRYDAGEPGLPAWPVRVYDSNNTELLAKTTDTAGAANFTRQLAPNATYKVCVDVAAGWTRTVPATLDPVLGKPCYTRTPTPGQTLTLRFGNKPLAVGAAAEEAVTEIVEDVTVEEAPELAPDESGYDAGYVEEEETTAPPADEPVPAQTQLLFLPLISNAR